MAEVHDWVNVCLSLALCFEGLVFCIVLLVWLAGEVALFTPCGEAPYGACAIVATICLTVYGLSKQ